MVSARQERRHVEHGSIICENNVLRLRVVRPYSSLGLIIEARDLRQQWVPLATTPTEGCAEYLDANGEALPMHFFAYDPLIIDEQAYGLVLHGYLGDAHLSLTTTLSETSTWTQHVLEIDGLPQTPCRRLMHHWRLPAEFLPADMAWPAHVLRAAALVETPAAFQQVGAFFAALVPDMEEGDSTLYALQNNVQRQASISYGIICGEGASVIPPSHLKFAYALCLDARALPQQGFQEIVRKLGSHDALAIVGTPTTLRRDGALPPLPPVPDTTEWIPFRQEGSPAAIAAWVHYLLLQAERGDWHLLEDALCWLDRLCFHQRVFETPGGAPLGSIGSDPAWQETALWMPALLLHAFRLTGILEYACRARAAISALAADMQARVMHHLSPRYGDIFVHAEYAEALALGPVEIHSAICLPDAISLEFERTSDDLPLRLVAEATTVPCQLSINGEVIGIFSPEQLSQGITIG